MRRISDHLGQAGFTLVEMITAITITAILAGIVALFIRLPLQGYFDVARRAELTDEADLAVRRMARDVQGALPNSVRVAAAGGVTYLEFLTVRTGGRYRTGPGAAPGQGGTAACPAGAVAGHDDVLEIGLADTCFHTLGATPNLNTVTAADWLVINNLSPDPVAAPDASAYAGPGGGSNRIGLNAVPAAGSGANWEDRFTFGGAGYAFPLASPSNRFFIVGGPVTYACAPAPGGGTLTRIDGYPIAAAQPTPPVGGTPALLANGVTACAISYDVSAAATRNGVVTVSLTLTRTDQTGSTENVNLYAQAHVVNAP
jgi:MSHA biogenesis protein MshO